MILVFDLDDTLYLERDYVRSGFVAVDAWLVAEYGVRGLFARAWSHFESGARGRIFDRVLPELGLAPEPTLIRRAIEIYRTHVPQISLTADAQRTLDRLHERHPLALLSDGLLQSQRRKVEALGLDRWCDPIVLTDQWGRHRWKPHAHGFLAIRRRFEQRPDDSFAYIADNPHKDFVAPRSLGWRTVRIKRPEGEHVLATAPCGQDAEITIITLDDLGSMLGLS